MGVVGGRGTVDAGVAAHVGAVPAGGEVLGVVGDGVLPSLESYVGIEESRVWDRWTLLMRWISEGNCED